MANLRIGYINHADSATLTASPVAATTMPVTYLQNDARGYVFRSTGLSAQDIKGEWGGIGKTIGCCVLHRHNLITNDTWRLILYPNADWTGTPLYDSTAVDAFVDNTFDDWDYGFSVMYFTAVAGVKSFKLTLTSAANPDGYMEAGRLFLGPYTEAEYNPAYGMTVGWAGNSTQARRDGGSLAVNVRAKWRTLAFDMMVSSEAQRAAWMEIGRYTMNEKTVWVSVFPTAGGTQERDHGILGKFDQSPLIKMSNTYDFSLLLKEL